MPIQVSQTALAIFLALVGIGVSLMLPNERWLGFVLIVLAIYILIIFGVKRERRSLTSIGIIPILWITLGSFLFIGGAVAVWRGANLAWPPTQKESNKRAELYESFMQEKTRRSHFYSEYAVNNMAIHGLLGQHKVPSLHNNPYINEEIRKRIERGEQYNREKAEEDGAFNALIASIQIHFPNSPKLQELTEGVLKPIIITIDEPGGLDGEAVKKWYKEQSETVNRQLDSKVQKPLDELANYLKENLK
ncbi:MAG: hypothetical protein Q8M54_12390 [Desulfobaccales bacterium]|nr:hypothetical protein [Desulfobaccales bacterium]